MEPSHIAWMKRLFQSLNDGGMWGIPRSGLAFRRDGEAMVLASFTPTDSPHIMAAQQEEFRQVQQHLAASNIEVRDETGLMLLDPNATFEEA